MIAYTRWVSATAPNLQTFANSNVGTLSTTDVSLDILGGSNLLRQGDHKTATPFFYSFTSNKTRFGTDLKVRYDAYSNVVLGGVSGTMGPVVVLTPQHSPDWSKTSQICLNKIYDQIRADSNIIVDALEGSQTLRMLRATLNLKKFVKEFFRTLIVPKNLNRKFSSSNLSGKLTTNQQRLDYVTGKWLEVRYGWTPLVLSIYDAADLLYRQEQARVISVKARSGFRHQLVGSSTGDGRYENPKVYQVDDWGYRSELLLRFKLPAGNQIYDWTSLNPASIAWELLPLSFVADWVINISEVLKQFENYWLFKNLFLDGWQSDSDYYNLYRVTKGTSTYEIYRYSDGMIMPNQTQSAQYSTTDVSLGRSHNRIILTSLPYSNPVRLRVQLGAKRQLDAAALIHQLVGKGFR